MPSSHGTTMSTALMRRSSLLVVEKEYTSLYGVMYEERKRASNQASEWMQPPMPQRCAWVRLALHRATHNSAASLFTTNSTTNLGLLVAAMLSTRA